MSPQLADPPPLAPSASPVAPRPGMRGGLQRRAAAVAAAGLRAAAPGGGAAAGADTTRYWGGSWKIAAAFVAILVVRVAEAFPVVRPLRPAILTALVSVALSVAYTPPSAWRMVWREPQFRRVLGYIAVAIAMLPFALWKGKSFGIAETMVLFDIPLVAAILLCAPRASTLERLFATFVASTTVYALAIKAIGARVEGDRLTSYGSYDANDLAALFCIALPMACAMVARRRAPGWMRLLGLVCAPILLYITTLTGSRGGLLALIAGLLVLLLGYNAARLVPAALVAVLATPVVWSQAPETFRRRALTLLDIESDYNANSTGGRKYIWKRGMAFFFQSPVIGVGPGNFDTRLGRDFKARNSFGAWYTAHNTPVQVLVELGIVGGVLYVVMLGATVRVAARVYRPKKLPDGRDAPHYPEFLAGLAAYATAAMFLSHAYVHFTFMIFALGGYGRRVFDRELGPARPRRLASGPR